MTESDFRPSASIGAHSSSGRVWAQAVEQELAIVWALTEVGHLSQRPSPPDGWARSPELSRSPSCSRSRSRRARRRARSRAARSRSGGTARRRRGAERTVARRLPKRRVQQRWLRPQEIAIAATIRIAMIPIVHPGVSIAVRLPVHARDKRCRSTMLAARHVTFERSGAIHATLRDVPSGRNRLQQFGFVCGQVSSTLP